jgi:hypothetical protein
VLDRLKLRQQIVVEVATLEGGVGEPGDGGNRRAQSVLVSFDVLDTASDARRPSRVNASMSFRSRCVTIDTCSPSTTR